MGSGVLFRKWWRPHRDSNPGFSLERAADSGNVSRETPTFGTRRGTFAKLWRYYVAAPLEARAMVLAMNVLTKLMYPHVLYIEGPKGHADVIILARSKAHLDAVMTIHKPVVPPGGDSVQ
jgi:hypothetical protein